MLLKLRAFLIGDTADGELDLFPLVPNAWFAEGFSMKNAPTFFGKLAFSVKAEGDSIFADIELEKSEAPDIIKARIANGNGEKPKSAKVNGKDADIGEDCRIALDPALGKWHMEAFF